MIIYLFMICQLVICTKKRRVADAVTYVEYIVEAIRNKELFHSIDISLHQCWLYLFWQDLSNYGGVCIFIIASYIHYIVI